MQRVVMARIFRLTALACGLFIAFTVIAMLVYPGGTIRHREIKGYAFFLDSLSDLGQTRTYAGQPNLPSMIFFCSALLLAAFALPAFFFAYARLFERRSTARRIAVIGAGTALTAGAAFAGIAATPANLFQAWHNVFVFVSYRAFFVAVLCAWLAATISRTLPARVGIVFGAFVLLLAAYIGASMAGHIPGNPSGHAFGATTQKAFVYASIVTILVQSASLERFMTRQWIGHG